LRTYFELENFGNLVETCSLFACAREDFSDPRSSLLAPPQRNDHIMDCKITKFRTDRMKREISVSHARSSIFFHSSTRCPTKHCVSQSESRFVWTPLNTRPLLAPKSFFYLPDGLQHVPRPQNIAPRSVLHCLIVR
jgi:hypothetical protein